MLPGIWREAFLREHEGREQELPVSRLQEAEALVLGNSVRGAMEVGEVVDEQGKVLWRNQAAAEQSSAEPWP